MIGRTILDLRAGRPGIWRILPEGVERLVQVPDEMRKSVFFLYYSKDGKKRPAGTGFHVGYLVPGYEDRPLGVALTAQHVIAGMRRVSDDGIAYIRLNQRDGGAVWASVALDSWLHLDPKVDCAMLPWRPDPEQNVDYRAWLLQQDENAGPNVATDEVIGREGIGIGDEVFMVGLFRNHLGRDRNEPIIRVGNIAAIPTDPVHTRAFGDMRAILIEARSIGGLSGSPVFVHMGFARWREGEVKRAGIADPFFFLGIMHGHWEATEQEEGLLLDEPGEKIHTGVGIVVPAEQVLRAVNPIMKEVARMARKKLDEEGAPTPDTSLDEQSEYERFEDLARKLIQVPKKELDEKRKKETG